MNQHLGHCPEKRQASHVPLLRAKPPWFWVSGFLGVPKDSSTAGGRAESGWGTQNPWPSMMRGCSDPYHHHASHGHQMMAGKEGQIPRGLGSSCWVHTPAPPPHPAPLPEALSSLFHTSKPCSSSSEHCHTEYPERGG